MPCCSREWKTIWKREKKPKKSFLLLWIFFPLVLSSFFLFWLFTSTLLLRTEMICCSRISGKAIPKMIFISCWVWGCFINKHVLLFLFCRKMLDPGLMLCSKQAMFLNLVYKSLKADIVLRRVKAFVKRLLQVTCEQMPPFICGALYLVSEILKAKPGLRSQLDDHPVYFTTAF